MERIWQVDQHELLIDEIIRQIIEGIVKGKQ